MKDLRSALAAGTKRPWDPSPISDDEIATYMFKPADARLIVAAVNNAEALLDRSDLHDHVVRRLEQLYLKLYGEGATGLLGELADIIDAARSEP